jgi:hypothetical protein
MHRQDSFAAVETAAGPTGPGPDAVRRALRGPPGRVALRLPAPTLPARRRVALALLEEAGRPRGGAVIETAQGEWLLTDSDPTDGARVAQLLERLMGAAPEQLALPEAVQTFLALPGLAPVAAASMAEPPAGGIEALGDAAPLPALLRRDGVLHLAAGVPQRLALLRLRLPAEALAPHLGACATDADLLRHAQDRLSGHLLAALADPPRRDDLLGAIPTVPLLIDLPLALLPDLPAASAQDVVAGAPSLIATLAPAEAMADGLGQRRAALRKAGWGLAVRGLDAAALTLLAPEVLPADLLLLRWSPGMQGRAVAAALRRVDPARLVLTRCDGTAALEWGVSIGVTRFAGPWIEAAMAARRMAECALAAGCSRAACAARGAAAAPEGRAGCGNLPLLAALLPAEAVP